jgi:biopolymer transport protein ExbB
MLRTTHRRIALAAVACCVLTGVVAAEQAAPQTTQSDIPYFYVFVVKSGPITWFIQIPLSVAMVALIIRYALVIRRQNVLPEETRQQIDEHFQAKQFREAMDMTAGDPSMLGQVINSGLHQAVNGFAAMQRAVVEAAEEQSIKLMRRIEVLNIIGNISPMIGLFGTVTGMIFAFWALVDIVQKGGVTDAAQLAAGIMYALGTTFWGLLVAIPALAAFSWFRGRIDTLTDETAATAEELIEVLRPAKK